MKKVFFLFTAVLLAAASLCGCGCSFRQEGKEDKQLRYKEGGAGVISLAVTNFDTFNPVLTDSDTVLEIDTLIYDGLFRRSADLSMVPVLAERMEVSSDGLAYTLHLRRDVTWHDGGRFSAYDVEYTVRAIENAPDSRLKYKLHGVESHAVLDSYTYEIRLSEPNCGFENRLDFPILKKGTDCEQIQPDYVPVGTSAYRYEPSALNRAHILRQNPDCVTAARGAVQEVIVKEIPDAARIMYALESREIEAVHVNGAQLMTYSAKGNVTTIPYTNQNFTFLGVNAQDALSDKQVRRALSRIIDRETVGKNAMFGRFTASDLPLVPGSRYNPLPEENTDRTQEDAQTLLTRAGFQRDGAGLWYRQTKDGVQYLNVTVLVCADNAVRCAAAEEIVKMLRASGIGASAEQTDFDTYTDRIAARAYTLFLGEVVLSGDLDLSVFAGSGARYASPGGQSMDTLLANAKKAVTQAQKDSAFSALADAFADEMPVIPLGFGQNALIVNDRISGTLHPVYHNIFCDFSEWKSN